MTASASQALLLIGSDVLNPTLHAKTQAQVRLCFNDNCCGTCQACHLINQAQHPDYTIVSPEGQANQIKIDMIREMQASAYHTPQLGHNRVIQINQADRMNTAAANALLKILEEPPASLYFILVAPHVYTIPATILSRCQKQHLTHTTAIYDNYLAIADAYEHGTPERQLFDNQQMVIDDLVMIHQQTIAITVVAKKWATYPMQPLLTLLILIYGQMLKHKLLQQPAINALQLLSPFYEAQQLSLHLQTLNKLLLNNISQVGLNQTMVLESFLIDT